MRVVAPGANLALCSQHVDDATLATAHTVLLQMETDPAQNAALLARARAAGCQTILNNAPARRLAPEVLALLGLLVVNETELAATLEGAAHAYAAAGLCVVPLHDVAGGHCSCPGGPECGISHCTIQ